MTALHYHCPACAEVLPRWVVQREHGRWDGVARLACSGCGRWLRTRWLRHSAVSCLWLAALVFGFSASGAFDAFRHGGAGAQLAVAGGFLAALFLPLDLLAPIVLPVVLVEPETARKPGPRWTWSWKRQALGAGLFGIFVMGCLLASWRTFPPPRAFVSGLVTVTLWTIVAVVWKGAFARWDEAYRRRTR